LHQKPRFVAHPALYFPSMQSSHPCLIKWFRCVRFGKRARWTQRPRVVLFLCTPSSGGSVSDGNYGNILRGRRSKTEWNVSVPAASDFPRWDPWIVFRLSTRTSVGPTRDLLWSLLFPEVMNLLLGDAKRAQWWRVWKLRSLMGIVGSTLD